VVNYAQYFRLEKMKNRYQIYLKLFLSLWLMLLIAPIATLTSAKVLTAESNKQHYPSLWDSNNRALQKKLENLVKEKGLWNATKSKQLSITIVDISQLNQPKLASLNGNQMFYAASLPKILILLAAFVEIEDGTLKESEMLYQQMTNMIRYSNNQSATYVLSLVGKKRLLKITQNPKYALYDPGHNGGLWLGKAYAKGKAYQRDPIHNLSHAATTIQAARFYYLLETGQLLNKENTKKMKEILSKPGIEHKFVRGLKSVDDISFYRKSGSWKNYHADSALVEYKDYKYIIIGLSNSKYGGKWLEKLALPIHQLITD
jgi:beta-lactamase class A